MEPHVSKFKLISGANVTSIGVRDREIRMLEAELLARLNARVASDRDLITYAHHFVRLSHPLLAQKYLNMLSSDYFDRGIYKDLFQSLLAWSITHINPEFANERYSRAYEYFLLVRRIPRTFVELTFESKLAFNRFCKQFNEYTTFRNDPPNGV